MQSAHKLRVCRHKASPLVLLHCRVTRLVCDPGRQRCSRRQPSSFPSTYGLRRSPVPRCTSRHYPRHRHREPRHRIFTTAARGGGDEVFGWATVPPGRQYLLNCFWCGSPLEYLLFPSIDRYESGPVRYWCGRCCRWKGYRVISSHLFSER